MKTKIYIAGAMTGYKHEMVAAERRLIKHILLSTLECEIIDPLDGFNIDECSNYSDRQVVTSNKYRIDRADIVFAMLNSPLISIGTIAEIVYAKEKGKFVIGIAPNKWANHPWINEHLDAVVDCVEEGAEYISLNL